MENVMETFEQLHQTYQRLIENSEEIFHALKHKDFPQLKLLNLKQLRGNDELMVHLTTLGNQVTEVCQSHGIGEAKLSSLLPLASLVEKERLLEHQQRAFQAEKQFKNNAHINQVLAEAMMSCSQTIVDTWVHVAQMENKNNSFVNRKM